MKRFSVLAASVAVLTMIAAAAMAGDTPSQSDEWGPGSMMGQGGQWNGPGYMMGYGNSGPGMMGMMGRRNFSAAMCTRMAGHLEGRLAYAKAELKITPAQEALWTAYAAAARDNAQSMTAHCTTMMGASGSATTSLPDRLDLHEQFMSAQLDSMRVLNASLKPLYASLTDAQKQTADQMFWSPMGMM